VPIEVDVPSGVSVGLGSGDRVAVLAGAAGVGVPGVCGGQNSPATTVEIGSPKTSG